MATTLWIIVAVVIVFALVVYRYRRKLVLHLKGWGVDATVRATDQEEKASTDPPERSVRIGGDAKDNRIVTGDTAPGTKPGAAGARSVAIGGNADGNTIMTGDGGETRRDIELYKQHLATAREIGDRHGEGSALGNLGIAYTNLGETRRALEYLGYAKVIFEEIGSPDAAKVRVMIADLNKEGGT
jgi:hypothetical protein